MAARRPCSRLVGQLTTSSKPLQTRSSHHAIRLAPLQLRPKISKQTPLPQIHSTYLNRYISTTRSLRKEVSPPTPKAYTFAEIQSLTTSPSSTRILIDVREPSELQSTGHIPTAINLPLKTSPDFMFLNAEEFEDRFGVPRPSQDAEVIFYCKSGVRSKAAAKLAQQAGFGGVVSEFPGSWLEWEKNGGKVERG